MYLEKTETLLKGSWASNGKDVILDETGRRIERLVQHHLVKIADREEGWIRLFQDPRDLRYWELSYPDSESHGGGAPLLTEVSLAEVRQLYGGLGDL